jgi:predicted RNA methylase
MMAEHPPAPFFYRLACPQGHDELAELELRALTGGGSEGGVGWAYLGGDVTRAAYVAEGARLLAAGASLKGMLQAAAKLHLRAERFRVSVHKLGGKVGPPSPEIEVAVANLIEGHPDLTRPACEFVVLASAGQWLLGELVSRYDKSWRGHECRPHQYSSALSPRFARALVNLVVRPGDRLLDPCCGAGTVLIEAVTVGAAAFGWDINRRLLPQAAGNLRHHSLEAALVLGDGRQVAGRFDGAVLDLPYGHSSVRDDAVCRELVANAARRAPLLAIVAAGSLVGLLEDLGLSVLGVARVPKGGIVRHVHWARSEELNASIGGQEC